MNSADQEGKAFYFVIAPHPEGEWVTLDTNGEWMSKDGPAKMEFTKIIEGFDIENINDPVAEPFTTNFPADHTVHVENKKRYTGLFRILLKFGDGKYTNNRRYHNFDKGKESVHGCFIHNPQIYIKPDGETNYGKQLETELLDKFHNRTDEGSTSEFHNVYIVGLENAHDFAKEMHGLEKCFQAIDPKDEKSEKKFKTAFNEVLEKYKEMGKLETKGPTLEKGKVPLPEQLEDAKPHVHNNKE